MTSATRTCARCGAVVVVAVGGARCPVCHHVVLGARNRVDLLARALPRTRATAPLRAAIREHRRQHRAAATFNVARILVGEQSATAGRVRPVADVLAELRQREAVT